MQKLALTYKNIEKVAFEFAKKYRLENDVPLLASGKDLEKYKEILYKKYGNIVSLVQKYISGQKRDFDHKFSHLEFVALNSGWLIEKYTSDKEMIENAVLTRLVHDIDRYYGNPEKHPISGEKTVLKLLSGQIEDKSLQKISLVTRYHDDINFLFEYKEIQFLYDSVFDADHFRWGLEREDTFWKTCEEKGLSPERTIHEYTFVQPYRDYFRTKYGKKVGPKYIDFGLAIAKSVEEYFSS